MLVRQPVGGRVCRPTEKHLCSSSQSLKPKATAEILRFAQDDTELFFSPVRSLSAERAAEPLEVALWQLDTRQPSLIAGWSQAAYSSTVIR
jgi:hypothetical protein